MSFPDTEFRGAKCVAVGFTPICSAADLRERHQSTSVIGLVFGDTCRRQED